eukprot:TRINITY_DN6656_c0_g1_i1.p1 TRINITY_DN6656_c0_g1~~TRINITY_DN6656_c0_g1_i1.p1  ORF type:complete len:371 (-),score=120.54 TRINITY_DN6656_c0_g1_i1:70-1182(-)
MLKHERSGSEVTTAGGGASAAEDEPPVTVAVAEVVPSPATLAARLAESSALWLVLWFSLNVSVTLFNKALFQFSTFTFPVTVSLVHMIVTALCSTFTMRVFNIPARPLNGPREYMTMLLMSILFFSNILTGNVGLRFVPVSLVQCVRSTTPGITMALSMVILGKRYSRMHFVSVALVVLGVATATYTTVEFHLVGFLFVVAVCFLSSLKSVMTSLFLTQKDMRFHPFDLLQRMSVMSTCHLLIVALVVGEPAQVLAWVQEHGTWAFAFNLFINGLMAFFLNITNFFFTKLTSALTVTIAGNVKHMCTIVLSILIFRNLVTFANALGITVTSAGAALYSYLEYLDKKWRSPSPPPEKELDKDECAAQASRV